MSSESTLPVDRLPSVSEGPDATDFEVDLEQLERLEADIAAVQAALVSLDGIEPATAPEADQAAAIVAVVDGLKLDDPAADDPSG